MSLAAATRAVSTAASRRPSLVSAKAAACIDRENRFGAFNYKPLPVVLSRGQGVHLYDVDGRAYLDMLSAYSAVNQGHCHPRLVAAMHKQASKLTLTSRAFHNDLLGEFEEFTCSLLGYDRMLPMNSGVEACETAVKLARRWGYDVKKIPDQQATVVVAKGNFWGRSIAALSSSTDPQSYERFGPFTPGFERVPYDDLGALETALQKENVAAFMVEPVQGEAGVVVPEQGYLHSVRKLCDKYNVLFIADEVQTGLGRCGHMLASTTDDNVNESSGDFVRADVIVLGKALSGGMMPVSCVLADDEVMLGLKPGEHGSTYGGNPLACAVAIEALKVVMDEDLCARSRRLGVTFREGLSSIGHPHIREVRGRGLLNAIEVEPSGDKTAYDVCLSMLDKGILAKQTQDHVIRFAPPLVIDEEHIAQSLGIIEQALDEF